ncbi:MAG: signal peptidase [Propionibacteriaceae bacterium]|jgi:signal peptidase I|nr:signal peptidase [Propionibacteriaceae bacterium]MDX6323030.1 signal peptidase [Propionibacteriaceae bacterium]
MKWKSAAAVGLVVAGAVVIRTQVIDTVSVSSDSMAPTVCTGGTVLIHKVHNPTDVAVDDIITFPNPQDGEPMIKRVVGVAGQRVAIEDAQLVVDRRPVDEPYVDHRTIDGVYFGPVTVPAGTVFVMGDHREVSIDSRAYGPIAISAIKGRMVAVIRESCEPDPEQPS